MIMPLSRLDHCALATVLSPKIASHSIFLKFDTAVQRTTRKRRLILLNANAARPLRHSFLRYKKRSPLKKHAKHVFRVWRASGYY